MPRKINPCEAETKKLLFDVPLVYLRCVFIGLSVNTPLVCAYLNYAAQ